MCYHKCAGCSVSSTGTYLPTCFQEEDVLVYPAGGGRGQAERPAGLPSVQAEQPGISVVGTQVCTEPPHSRPLSASPLKQFTFSPNEINDLTDLELQVSKYVKSLISVALGRQVPND